jgi:hypothetical protein
LRGLELRQYRLCNFQVASAIRQLTDVFRQSSDSLPLAGDMVLALNDTALGLRKMVFQPRPVHAETIAQ